MYRVSTIPTDWRGAAKMLKEIKQEIDQYHSIMTPYEQSAVMRDFAAKRDTYERMIVSGALGEWDQAIDRMKTALRVVENEKRKEINRWDSSRLSSEMQVIEMRLKKAIEGSLFNGVLDHQGIEQVRAIYQEAQSSQDTHKQRAAAEAVQGIVKNIPQGDLESRRLANLISKQAARDLESLRDTEDIQRAHRLADERVQELNQAKNTIFEAAASLDQIHPNGEIGNFTLYKALGRVKQDDEGSFIFADE